MSCFTRNYIAEALRAPVVVRWAGRLPRLVHESGADARWLLCHQDISTSCTYELGPSVILSADIMPGFLEGDVAKGYTQGAKLKSFKSTMYWWEYGNAPSTKACAHTYTHAHTVYLKVLLLAL